MEYRRNPLKHIREYIEVVKPLSLLQNYMKMAYKKYEEPKLDYLPPPFRGSYGPLK